MLPLLLFILYLVTGIWLLHRLAARYIFPFSFAQTAAIVCFKVMLACLYGYIFLHYYHGDDTWDIFYQSLGSYERLTHYPAEFFSEFNPARAVEMANHQTSGAAFYYYNHLESWIMVKAFAVLNLISARNYYVDALLFDLIVLAGPLLIFKYVRGICSGRSWPLMIVVFFIPTLTFWLSGIRAEGLLLLFTAGLLRAVKSQEGSKFFTAFICLLACALFRIQYALLLIPALIAYRWSLKDPAKTWRNFFTVYAVLAGCFLLSLWLPANQQGSFPIRKAQAAFFALHGNTRFPLDSLQAGPASFLTLIPAAALNGLVRPVPWEAKGWLQWAVAFEKSALLACFLILLFRSKGRFALKAHPLLLLFLFFSFSLILLEAMIVPFPGALVRYTAIPEWLLVITALAGFYPTVKNPVT